MTRSNFPAAEEKLARAVALSYNDTFYSILWEWKTPPTNLNYQISIVFCLSSTFTCKVKSIEKKKCLEEESEISFLSIYRATLSAFPRSFLPAPMIGIGPCTLVVFAGSALT